MTCIRMLSTAEASERLGVSQRTLIRWRQSVPIIGPPPIRIGNAIRYAVQGDVDGIRYKLVSADGLRFCPYRIN